QVGRQADPRWTSKPTATPCNHTNTFSVAPAWRGPASGSSPFCWYFSGRIAAARSNHDKSRKILEKRIYRFRDFELEPDERRLSQGGKQIALTPKVFDTLVLLVER